MATVIANLAMSVDGFIAYPDDSVGELFDWYSDGDVSYQGDNGPAFKVSQTTAEVLREAFESVGCFLVGRRLYDHTNGWNAKPPMNVPMVVVTHEAPDDWPRDGVPITFATQGIEQAVAEASEIAGDRVVAVAGANVARECLAAGLLDEIYVNLVPLVMGEGIPFFAGTAGAPYRLSDPEVVEAPGVTHLRYRVKR